MTQTASSFTKPGTRFTIIGATGSGKTPLAHSLGERFELPVIELDAMYWMPC